MTRRCREKCRVLRVGTASGGAVVGGVVGFGADGQPEAGPARTRSPRVRRRLISTQAAVAVSRPARAALEALELLARQQGASKRLKVRTLEHTSH